MKPGEQVSGRGCTGETVPAGRAAGLGNSGDAQGSRDAKHMQSLGPTNGHMG